MLTPEPQETKKNSSQVWKWIGIGCGSLTIIFILLGVGLFFLVQRSLNLSFDSENAEEAARSIMDYEMPGDPRGMMSMNIAGVEMAGVISLSEDFNATLVLGRVDAAADQSSAAQIQTQFEENLEEQQPGNFTVNNSRVEQRELCDQTVALNILEGEQTGLGQSPVAAYTYQTTLTHDEELLLVSLSVTGTGAEALAEQIFNSLDCQ